MSTLNRRALLRVVAQSTAAIAVPLAFPPAIAAPAGSEAVQEADWAQEWEEVVASAKAEGTLSLVTWGDTWGGVGYPVVIDRFKRSFPGIAVEWLAESAADAWLARVRQERRSGSSSFDLALVQPDAALKEGAPEGMWAPIEPRLVRSDVRDDRAWRDGFDARFLDSGGNLCFSWEYQVIHTYAINTDLVQPGEIGTVKELVEPKWTGKVISSDPRIGFGLLSAAAVARHWGTDVVRQLLVDQRPMVAETGHELAEALVLGRYPVALGVRPKALEEFWEQGLGGNVEFLDLPDADFAATTPLLLFARAPHPAAATLFANWILTREGQTILTRSLPTNSARIDVEPFVPEGIATAGMTYYEPDREANFEHTAEIQAFIADVLAMTP